MAKNSLKNADERWENISGQHTLAYQTLWLNWSKQIYLLFETVRLWEPWTDCDL